MVNERRQVSEIKNYGSIHFFYYKVQSNDRRREYYILYSCITKIAKTIIVIENDLFIAKINYINNPNIRITIYQNDETLHCEHYSPYMLG